MKIMRYELTKDAIDYICSTRHFKDVERVRSICEMRLQNKTYQEIGEVVGLSSSRCREICDRTARIYASDIRTGKAMQSVNWRWEFGLCVPFCPYCDELAYEHDSCVFCGRKYKYTESPAKDTRVVVGGYTVTQLSNNAVYVTKGDRIVMHASSAKKMTEEELKGVVTLCEYLRNKNIDGLLGEEDMNDEQREAD